MQLTLTNAELKRALRWLKDASSLAGESSLILRFVAHSGWEWSCGGQTLIVSASGTWDRAMRTSAKPLLALHEVPPTAPQVTIARCDGGFIIDGVKISAVILSDEPSRAVIPIGAPLVVVLREIAQHGEKALLDAGYREIVTRTLSLKEERVRDAVALLASLGVRDDEVGALVSAGIDSDRRAGHWESEARRVTIAARAFELLAEVGVDWAELWSLVNTRR